MNDLEIMKNWLQNDYSLGLPKDVSDIIKSNLPSKYRKKTWITKVGLIIHRLSEMPWYTQEKISNELGTDKETLIELNKIIYLNLDLHKIIFL